MNAAVDLFTEAMRSAGLDPAEIPTADGVFRRIRDNQDKPGKKDLYYILHGDGIPAGNFGHWSRLPDGQNWQAKPDNTLTPQERTHIKERVEQSRAARDKARDEVRAACRTKAAKLLEAAQDVKADHPYLEKKNIKPYGARQSKDMLLLPVRKKTTLTGLQIITPDGVKKFLTGTEKAGAYLAIKGKGKIVYLVEGWATGCTIHELTGATVIICFDCGNLEAVSKEIRATGPDYEMVMVADNDRLTDGNPGLTKARAAALAIGARLAIPTFPGDTGTDANDLAEISGAAAVMSCLEAAAMVDPITTPDTGTATETATGEANGLECIEEIAPARIQIIDALDFMAMKFPPRENIFSPWLPRQGLTMVYAPRGVGKTHVSLGIGYAVTSAGSFLGWHAETPRNVLFIDGEMPAVVLQERIARIAASNDKEPAAKFRIYTPDMQPNGMINLSCPNDQAALEPFLEDIDLIILDNLSTLCRSGRENEGEAWLPVQQWALQQRAAGRSVLFIHHAGKNGEQRGSSRREDVLDTVISLKRPGDYTPDLGACFEVHFEKARGLFGDDTKPFEARLMTAADDTQTWAMQPLENSTAEKVAALLNDGIPQSEIGELLNLSKGAVSKAKTKAAGMGLLKAVS